MNSWLYEACIGMLCAALLVAVFWCPAHAGDYRVGVMPQSHHWHARANGEYVERNRGLFGEVRVADDSFLGIMNYDNSVGGNSNAVYYIRDLPINDAFSWGYTFGLVGGYPALDPAPLAALVFTIHIGGPVKQRTLIIPEVVNAYELYVEF